MIFWTLLLSIISAIMYRFGGMGKAGHMDYFPYLPRNLFNKLVRRLGCTFIGILWMVIFYPTVPWWVHILSFGLCYPGITSYFDEQFGYDNHYAHGFAIAFGCILYPLFTGMWVGFGLRCIVLSLLMGLVSTKWGESIVVFLKGTLSKYPKLYSKLERFIRDDFVEECFRGLFIILTKILMLLK